jgi:hypothetical protein
MTRRRTKVFVALNRPEKVPDLMAFVDAIVQRMTGNSWFPDPDPPLAVVASAIAELREAQVLTDLRARGTASARDAKLEPLLGLLDRLKAYVERVANDNPEHAAEIIESAAMSVKKSSAYVPPPFSVQQGPTSGSALLRARSAGDRGTHYWQSSTDGGKTWSPTTKTYNKAETILSGFTPGQNVWFRHSVLTKDGEGDWCDPIALIIK